MLKEVIRSIDSGILPLIGLFAFLIAFVVMVVWAFSMKKEARNAAKHQPLEDAKEALL